MKMLLKAIFAVCLLGNTILATSQKFARQMQILTSFLNTTCSTLKDLPCGNQRVKEIRMEFSLNNKEPCTTYREIFCKINKALRELNHTCKNITSTVTEEMSDFLKRPVSCTLSLDRTTMKEFCPKLRDYFQRLYNICTV